MHRSWGPSCAVDMRASAAAGGASDALRHRSGGRRAMRMRRTGHREGWSGLPRGSRSIHRRERIRLAGEEEEGEKDSTPVVLRAVKSGPSSGRCQACSAERKAERRLGEEGPGGKAPATKSPPARGVIHRARPVDWNSSMDENNGVAWSPEAVHPGGGRKVVDADAIGEEERRRGNGRGRRRGR